ncbi:hypothetical protein [Nocardia wallacei]|uniref:hypothetical protein n=1 Tax=Nocardia wallacei TaxID=480035 RepID=UPI002455BA40|nr:hypothetical protein [Nocardia wallacei]
MKSDDPKGPRRDRWITERPWELEYFDPERWRPLELWRRAGVWIGATRRRRWTAWALVVVFMVFVFPMAVGSVAIAQSGSGTATANGLGFLEVRDSSGVDVSQYTFATNHGGILNPGKTFISSFIVILFAGWLFIAQSLVWLVGKGIDLSWLDTFRQPLLGAAQSFADQIGTLAVSFTAAAIGAFFIAYFIVRGFIAKAIRQIVAILLAATFSGFFLTNPMAHELSTDGWLAQGRDVGLSVAAGLNGNSNPNPNALIPTLQATMADNFIRKPLQVWNFGHVVDTRPECKAMWSTATTVGDEDQIKEGMKTCGDYGAYKSADNPRAAQIAIGFLLILIQIILFVGFGFMIVNLTRAVISIFIHGFMIIFGFAAGAYVYGPSQTFLVRNLVSTWFAVLRFMAYCAATGLILLLSDSIMRQAGGNVLPVLVLWAFFMVVGVVEFRHLRDNMQTSSDWVANRTALAIQGAGGSGGGGGGGRALGMGDSSPGPNHFKMMAAMAGANTISNFAPFEWMVGAIPGFGHPGSKQKADEAKQKRALSKEKRYGGKHGWNYINNMKWEALSVGARNAARQYGGVDTILGNAAAVQGVVDRGAFASDAFAAIIGAGGKNEGMAHLAQESRGVVNRMGANEPFKDKDLSLLAASVRHAQNRSISLLDGTGATHAEVAADFGTMYEAAKMYRGTQMGGSIHLTQEQRNWALRYMSDTTPLADKDSMIAALNDISHKGRITGPAPDVHTQELYNMGIDHVGAERMRRWITNEHALRIERTAETFVGDVTNLDAMRNLRNETYEAIRTHNLINGDNKSSPSLSVTPTSGTMHHRDQEWARTMAPVAQMRWRR